MFNNSVRLCTGLMPISGEDTMITMSETGKFMGERCNMFGEQNRKRRHFALNHCIDQSIKGKRMLTLPVVQDKQVVRAF